MFLVDTDKIILNLNGKAKELCVCQSLSCVCLFATPWTVAHQAPLSMGISRQEYWSGMPCPSPGDLPDPGIETGSPSLQADSLPSEPPGIQMHYDLNKRSLFSSVQSLSHVQLCDPMDCSMPGLPIHHQLPELGQTHVH